jgi:hypothetical protein
MGEKRSSGMVGDSRFFQFIECAFHAQALRLRRLSFAKWRQPSGKCELRRLIGGLYSRVAVTPQNVQSSTGHVTQSLYN